MANNTAPLEENQFRISEVPPGSVLLVGSVAVFNVDGAFCATQATCPHRQGPLNEGTLEGSTVTCPWHGSEFNVCTGAVLRGPAKGSAQDVQRDRRGRSRAYRRSARTVCPRRVTCEASHVGAQGRRHQPRRCVVVAVRSRTTRAHDHVPVPLCGVQPEAGHGRRSHRRAGRGC